MVVDVVVFVVVVVDIVVFHVDGKGGGGPTAGGPSFKRRTKS